MTDQIRDRIKSLRRVPAGKLKPHPENFRKHPEKQRAAMSAALAEIGWADAVIARELEDGTLQIIDGHLRADIDPKLKVPVLIVDLDDHEALKLLATHDLITIMADIDADMLTGLREQIDFQADELDALVEKFAYTDASQALSNVAEDDPGPAANAAPSVVQQGDIWQLGAHRLICGDCTNVGVVAALLSGVESDLFCFTSPPYADQRDYDAASGNLDPVHLATFIDACHERVPYVCVNLGIKRVDGAIDRYDEAYRDAAVDNGLKLLAHNVWHKTDGASVGMVTAMFPIVHEWIYVFGPEPLDLTKTIVNKTGGQTTTTTNRTADGKRRDVVHTKNSCGTLRSIVATPCAKSNENHSATFPVRLPAEYIAAFDRDVYEPFAGSGTTIIAAEQLDRACFACEIEPKYCDAIIERWQDFTGESAQKVGP